MVDEILDPNKKKDELLNNDVNENNEVSSVEANDMLIKEAMHDIFEGSGDPIST
jgi:hypothetical protein